MEQIRLGLKNNIDVLIYAKKEFDFWKMEEIRIGLEKKKINVFIYPKLKYFLNKIILKLLRKN